MQKRAELIGARYAISERFVDQMGFPEKLLESAGIPSNCKMMSLNSFVAWVHSMFSAEEALKVGSIRTH